MIQILNPNLYLSALSLYEFVLWLSWYNFIQRIRRSSETSKKMKNVIVAATSTNTSTDDAVGATANTKKKLKHTSKTVTKETAADAANPTEGTNVIINNSSAKKSGK